MLSNIYEYAINVKLGQMTIEEDNNVLPKVPTLYINEVKKVIENEDLKIIEYAKNKKWEEIKAARDTAETSGCPFKEKVLDSDERSVIKINTAVSAAQIAGPEFTIDWTMQDNSVLKLTYEDVLQMPIALALYSNSLHEKARLLREQIYSSDDINFITNLKWES